MFRVVFDISLKSKAVRGYFMCVFPQVYNMVRYVKSVIVQVHVQTTQYTYTQHGFAAAGSRRQNGKIRLWFEL